MRQLALPSAFCDSEIYKQHAQPGIKSSWTILICQLKQLKQRILFIYDRSSFILIPISKGGWGRRVLTQEQRYYLC